MWPIASATKARKDLFNPSGSLLRNVINSSNKHAARRALSSSSSPDVAVQLDYFMSHQFAGVATALVDGIYTSNGIEPHFLPTCPVGQEMANVRAYQDANPSTLVTLGSVEQNIFTPLLYSNPGLRLTGVASMMRQSPLCIASLKELNEGDTIGCHEDTVDLLKRIYPQLTIVASPKGTKNGDLLNGKYDGIQAYTTTEVPALQRMLKERGMDPGSLHAMALEDGVSGVKLGYSQLLFVADEGLSSPDRREAATAFLQSTFDGWQISIRDPSRAIEAVAEAQRMLKLDDEANDHWHPSDEFQQDMLRLMNDQVKESFAGDKLGVLHEKRWSEATTWLLGGGENASDNVDPKLGLDKTGLWRPSSQLLHGNELGKEIMQSAKSSAYKFEREVGRKPRLGVITVGQLKRYEHGSRRLELYSNPSSSWFNKTDAGMANGFEVQEINLDARTATTETLLSEIYKLRGEVDGIQIMWPLPEHIDSSAVFNAVPLEMDVDGIHYVGQKEIGNCRAYAPVTPAGAVELMKAHGVDVAGKHVVVVGRSPIVGSPVSRMIRDMGAAVTVGHRGLSTDALKNLVGSADIVVTCAGDPSAVHADWLSDGCEVVNIGTTFCEDKDSLLSDVEGDIAAKAKRYSPVPGGVGPLSNPILFRNVARAAWDQAEGPQGWNKEPSKLTKSYHFDSYTKALEFMTKVNAMSTIMDHHANISIRHACVDGVDLTLEWFSFEAQQLTEKDFDAARAVDLVYGGNRIKMEDYAYDLKDESIALFPASIRGTSKLLRVDDTGYVSYHKNFAESVPSLIKGCHLVLNDSKVLDARLSVTTAPGISKELMLLDLGNICPQSPCKEFTIQAMIRHDCVSKGDIYSIKESQVEVVEVRGVWKEDKESGGNGTDCFVRILSDDTLPMFLDRHGSVPIPPYFHREAEESDKERYNTVYAQDAGSVAAPTAGLHFTNDVLKEIGENNMSSLTLHVGAGTFMPVLSKDARDHSMHAEHFFCQVGEVRAIVNALEKGKPICVVGTTSTRTLETLFWLGVKRIKGLESKDDELELKQFDWVPLSVGDGKRTSPISALRALIEGKSDDAVISGKTSLMITPKAYDFKVVDHLVTNFHAPDSTLMLLVSAFLGRQTKIGEVYGAAQRRGYKFLSYGDSCLLSKPGVRLPSREKGSR